MKQVPARASNLIPREKPKWLKLLLYFLLGLFIVLFGRELKKLLGDKL